MSDEYCLMCCGPCLYAAELERIRSEWPAALTKKWESDLKEMDA